MMATHRSFVHRSFVHRGSLIAGMALMLLTSTWQTALATTYRCEIPAPQAGMKPEVRYQGQACEGGRALQAADQRTDAQRADTAKATQASAKLGRELARERRRQEKKSADQGPLAMDAIKPKAKASDNSTQGPTLKRHRPFTAKVPKAKADSKMPGSN